MNQLLQWTWCLPQNILGLFVFIFTKIQRAKSEPHRGAMVTRWRYSSGVSLGQFIFVSKNAGEPTIKHEYGHTRQSMLLGPLYLLVIGLPSIIWAGCFDNYRQKHNKSYYDFYTESWADKLGSVER